MHPLLIEIFEAASLSPTGSEGIVSAGGRQWFAKTGGATVRAEATSLLAMRASDSPIVPKILGYRDDNGTAALVTSYASGGKGNMGVLGRCLAEMHVPSDRHNGKYGFPVPTFCGATKQDNTWEDSWEVFFRDRRLGDMVTRLRDGSTSKEWKRMKEKVVPLLLRDIRPAPLPVPLHGDLWPGNVASDEGQPIIFDPCSYYGHGEADLGMTRMFGGFSPEFYAAYHSVHPRSEPHYEQRIRLYELYHHLNHALLFGGGYRASALRIMRELADWADTVEDK